MTIPRQPQFERTLTRHAEKLHAATVLRESRTDFLDRAADTRFEIDRMKSMHEQQTRDQLVLADSVDDGLALRPGIVNQLHQSFQSGALQLVQSFHQFPRLTPRFLIRDSVDRLNQLFDSTDPSLKFPRLKWFHECFPWFICAPLRRALIIVYG